MTVYQIGRSQQNDIVINDRSVSRRHAELEASKDGEFVLIDLDSTNGTCIREGSKWVEIEKASVDHGERILIGEVITTVAAMLADRHAKATADAKGKAPAARPAASSPRTNAPDLEREPSFAPRRTPSGRPIESTPASPEAKEGAPADTPSADRPALAPGTRTIAEPAFDEEPEPQPRKRRWFFAVTIAALLLAFMSAGTYAFLNYGDDFFASAVESAGKLGIVKPRSADRPKPATWQKILGGDKVDVVHAVATTPDGGFVLAGTTNSRGAGAYDIWVVSLDKDGRRRWAKTYGGPGDDVAVSIGRVPGGFILAGWSRARDKRKARAWTLKLDRKGGKQWERAVGDDGHQFAEAIIDTRDGGFALAITARTASHPGGRTRVVKLNAKGQIRWSRYFGEGGTTPSDIQRSHNGGYIVAGTSDPDGSGRSALWVLRLDRAGKRVWEQTYPGSRSDAQPRIRRARNRQYIVVVSTESFPTSKRPAEPLDVRLLRLNDSGRKIWDRVHVTPTADRAAAVVLTRGGIIVAGSSNGRGRNRHDLWVARFDTKVKLVWQRRYGGRGVDLATDMRQRRGGLVLAGKTSASGTNKWDAWILKLDSAGRLER